VLDEVTVLFGRLPHAGEFRAHAASSQS